MPYLTVGSFIRAARGARSVWAGKQPDMSEHKKTEHKYLGQFLLASGGGLGEHKYIAEENDET